MLGGLFGISLQHSVRFVVTTGTIALLRRLTPLTRQAEIEQRGERRETLSINLNPGE